MKQWSLASQAWQCGFIVFFLLLGVQLPSEASRKSRQISSVDAVSMCKDEAQTRLLRLEVRNQPRFTEVKFASDSAKVEEAEFSDMLGVAKRKRSRDPGHAVTGQMVLLEAHGKDREREKWREVKVRCGIAKNKVTTFTYELHAFLDR